MIFARAIDPGFVLANRIEACLWCLIGITFLVTSRFQRRANRIDARIAAITFILFGVSDLIEATTGAWWRPWWLLAWKGTCLLVLIAITLRYTFRKHID